MSERRHLIVLVLSAVALLGFFFGVLKPRSTQAAELRQEISAARSEARALSDKLVALQQLEANRGELEAEVAEMAEYLPQHAHVVRLVRALTRAEKIAGVDLLQIAPTKPSEHEKVPGAGIMTASVVLTGNYDRIESFQVQLEQLERALEVTSISLAPSVDEETDRVTLTATMTLQMYTFDRTGVTAAPPVAEEVDA